MTRDEKFMALALKLARKGLYKTWPNLAVGAVLVKNGRMVARGWHRKAGGPHAEAAALKQAGAKAKGATAYVTLEPCNHQGRTPPCSEALRQAGVKRVVVAAKDPHPLARGGAAWLKRKGIRVTTGVLEKEAAELNRHFFFAVKNARPWITLKAAMSLDGRAAFLDGRSKWITSPEARSDARRLRGRCDGVVVGGATVLNDDPSLLPEKATGAPPARFILDWKGRVKGSERVFHDSLAKSTYWITSDPASAKLKKALKHGANLVLMRPKARMSDNAIAFARMAGGLNYRRLWVEGGPQILGAFLSAGLAEDMYLYQSAGIWGAVDSRPVFEGLGSADANGVMRLKDWKVKKVGADLRWHGRI